MRRHTALHALALMLWASFSFASEGGYVLSADGQTVTDSKTGLVWMRCSQGQRWDGKRCAGTATKVDWPTAQQAPASASGWRMPTLAELETLVQCSTEQRKPYFRDGTGGECEGDYLQPAVDPAAFPNTPSGCAWSSTVKGDSKGSVSMGSGYVDYGYSTHLCSVRLVRGGR